MALNSPSAAVPDYEPVLEILAIADDTQVVIARLPDGKLKATSKSWDEGKVFLPGQVLEQSTAGFGWRGRKTDGMPANCGAPLSRSASRTIPISTEPDVTPSPCGT